jgi:hypothetical protein
MKLPKVTEYTGQTGKAELADLLTKTQSWYASKGKIACEIKTPDVVQQRMDDGARGFMVLDKGVAVVGELHYFILNAVPPIHTWISTAVQPDADPTFLAAAYLAIHSRASEVAESLGIKLSTARLATWETELLEALKLPGCYKFEPQGTDMVRGGPGCYLITCEIGGAQRAAIAKAVDAL